MSRSKPSRVLLEELVRGFADRCSGRVDVPGQVTVWQGAFEHWDADDLIAACDTYTTRSTGTLWTDFPTPAAIAVFKPGRAEEFDDEAARREDCYCDRDGYLRYPMIEGVAHPELGRIIGTGWGDKWECVIPCSRCNPRAFRRWRLGAVDDSVWTGEAPWWEGPEWRTKVAGTDTQVEPAAGGASVTDIGAMP